VPDPRPRRALPPLRPLLAVFSYWAQERRTLRQGFTALAISTCVGLAAGLVLGFMEELLEAIPGLLMLVPAAIGMRGAIFGALGARLGTGILTGQFDGSVGRDSFGRQNLLAAAAMTFYSSALAALAARGVAALFGLPSVSVWQLMVVSMVGGLLASAFIAVMVVLLARTALSRNWDMDAIGAPLVTTVGDIVTLPALVLATFMIHNQLFATVAGIVLLGSAVAAVVLGLRARGELTRRICRQSIAVLGYAAVVDVLAGGVLEAQVEAFLVNPALLVLIPPFIANCGSLGGILSARLGSELHLGLISPRRVPEPQAGLEASLAVLFSVAAFGGVGLIAHVVSTLVGFGSPGLGVMVGVALLGGAFAFVLLFLVAYYVAIASYRFGLDPDNYGIPVVTATMDFFGVLCLVAAIFTFGVN
jgi:mgtE-like transporter